jgi:hypothetical protein
MKYTKHLDSQNEMNSVASALFFILVGVSTLGVGTLLHSVGGALGNFLFG